MENGGGDEVQCIEPLSGIRSPASGVLASPHPTPPPPPRGPQDSGGALPGGSGSPEQWRDSSSTHCRSCPRASTLAVPSAGCCRFKGPGFLFPFSSYALSAPPESARADRERLPEHRHHLVCVFRFPSSLPSCLPARVPASQSSLQLAL